MSEPMTRWTQSDEIIQIGGAALGPGRAMVDFQMRARASGCRAFPVLTCDDRMALFRCRQPGAPAHVQYPSLGYRTGSLPVRDDHGGLRDAGQVEQKTGADGPKTSRLCGHCFCGAVMRVARQNSGESVRVDHHLQMWANSFIGWQVLRQD